MARRRSGQHDEQKIREKCPVFIDCSGSNRPFAISAPSVCSLICVRGPRQRGLSRKIRSTPDFKWTRSVVERKIGMADQRWKCQNLAQPCLSQGLRQFFRPCRGPLAGARCLLMAGTWLVETVLPYRPSNISLGPGRRSTRHDEQEIRGKYHVFINISGS